MNSKTTTTQSKPRARRKNKTILPVMLASAALFASIGGFLGLHVAAGNDPMLGAGATSTQAASSAANPDSNARSQSSTPKPTPVQTSTSG
jgi:anti-sigma factor RsiW